MVAIDASERKVHIEIIVIVVMLIETVLKGVGQGVGDVARDHANLPVAISGDVASQTMDVRAEHGGLESC